MWLSICVFVVVIACVSVRVFMCVSMCVSMCVRSYSMKHTNTYTYTHNETLTMTNTQTMAHTRRHTHTQHTNTHYETYTMTEIRALKCTCVFECVILYAVFFEYKFGYLKKDGIDTNLSFFTFTNRILQIVFVYLIYFLFGFYW